MSMNHDYETGVATMKRYQEVMVALSEYVMTNRLKRPLAPPQSMF